MRSATLAARKRLLRPCSEGVPPAFREDVPTPAPPHPDAISRPESDRTTARVDITLRLRREIPAGTPNAAHPESNGESGPCRKGHLGRSIGPQVLVSRQ